MATVLPPPPVNDVFPVPTRGHGVIVWIVFALSAGGLWATAAGLTIGVPAMEGTARTFIDRALSPAPEEFHILEDALHQFRADLGRYPRHAEGLGVLIEADFLIAEADDSETDVAAAWNGPYVPEGLLAYDEVAGTFLDDYGNTIVYLVHRGDPEAVALFSPGDDGVIETDGILGGAWPDDAAGDDIFYVIADPEE